MDLTSLELATQTLGHRGPDDEGYLLINTVTGEATPCSGSDTMLGLNLPLLATQFDRPFDLALGFRRLSILDLSAAGHQPMCSHDGRLWIVFNGEIFNFVELRDELVAAGYRFRTGTDTEVILAAYRHWDEGCVRRFNGMWAFAIWDVDRKRLFLARDRMGIKPLYTTPTETGTLAFASEIKSLLASGLVAFQPRVECVARFIATSAFPSQRLGDSFFENVKVFPQGHTAIVDRNRFASREYWSIPEPRLRDALTDADAIETYRRLFCDAVRLRLQGDVPVGTCLSGGLDSSTIVAVLADLYRTHHDEAVTHLGAIQKTFSAVYETVGPWNERRYIDRVLDKYTVTPFFVYPTSENLWNEAETMAWHLEEPCWSTSMFAQWAVLKEVRKQGVTIVINGQGSDELLAGYQPGVFRVLLRELFCHGKYVEAWKNASEISDLHDLSAWRLFSQAADERTRMWLRSCLSVFRSGFLSGRAFRRSVCNSGVSAELQDVLCKDDRTFELELAEQETMHEFLKYSFLETPLQPILRYEDRLSMAHSLESRLPFLDHRLVEFVFQNASTLRIRNGWTKWIHRQAFSDFLPRGITWRRDKVGFDTPLQQWLTDGRDFIRDLLLADTVRTYLDPAQVEAQLKTTNPTMAGAKRIWRWVSVALWLNTYRREASQWTRAPMISHH